MGYYLHILLTIGKHLCTWAQRSVYVLNHAICMYIFILNADYWVSQNTLLLHLFIIFGIGNNGGKDFPKQFLLDIYERIKKVGFTCTFAVNSCKFLHWADSICNWTRPHYRVDGITAAVGGIINPCRHSCLSLMPFPLPPFLSPSSACVCICCGYILHLLLPFCFLSEPCQSTAQSRHEGLCLWAGWHTQP